MGREQATNACGAATCGKPPLLATTAQVSSALLCIALSPPLPGDSVCVCVCARVCVWISTEGTALLQPTHARLRCASPAAPTDSSPSPQLGCAHACCFNVVCVCQHAERMRGGALGACSVTCSLCVPNVPEGCPWILFCFCLQSFCLLLSSLLSSSLLSSALLLCCPVAFFALEPGPPDMQGGAQWRSASWSREWM